MIFQAQKSFRKKYVNGKHKFLLWNPKMHVWSIQRIVHFFKKMVYKITVFGLTFGLLYLYSLIRLPVLDSMLTLLGGIDGTQIPSYAQQFSFTTLWELYYQYYRSLSPSPSAFPGSMLPLLVPISWCYQYRHWRLYFLFGYQRGCFLMVTEAIFFQVMLPSMALFLTYAFVFPVARRWPV